MGKELHQKLSAVDEYDLCITSYEMIKSEYFQVKIRRKKFHFKLFYFI